MERSPISLSNSRVKVRPGDNWLVVGRKGSGKTTFGKMLSHSLLELYPTARLYVLDIKLRDFNTYPGIFSGDGLPPKPKSNERVQVWQPQIIRPENVEAWLYRIRQDPPAILHLDELLAVCYKHNEPSEELTRIAKLGRALPISTISHTQDVVDLPRGILSQPDHIVRFRLKNRYDRRYMDNLFETERMSEPRDEHGMWYVHAESGGEPQYFPSAQHFLGLHE